MITDNFNNCNELQRIKISLIKYQLSILVFMHISFSLHLLLLLLLRSGNILKKLHSRFTSPAYVVVGGSRRESAVSGVSSQ